MKRYNDDFRSNLLGFDLDTLENSKQTIFAVSRGMGLIYFNPAYFEFAEKNGAKNNFIEIHPLHSSLFDAIKGEHIKEFYQENYRKVLETGEVWQHEYECSSDKEFRQYHQGAYPLKNGSGLLIVNTQLVQFAMSLLEREEKSAMNDRYLQSNGLITQCSNCRCFQRSDGNEIWDWIPEWMKNMPDNLSHTICPICYDYNWKYFKIKYKANDSKHQALSWDHANKTGVKDKPHTADHVVRLRTELRVKPDTKILLLIGKHGTIKRRAPINTDLCDIFLQIEEMPMRRTEILEKIKAGRSLTRPQTENDGVKQIYRFASPDNKRSTGHLDRFITMVRSIPYDRPSVPSHMERSTPPMVEHENS